MVAAGLIQECARLVRWRGAPLGSPPLPSLVLDAQAELAGQRHALETSQSWRPDIPCPIHVQFRRCWLKVQTLFLDLILKYASNVPHLSDAFESQPSSGEYMWHEWIFHLSVNFRTEALFNSHPLFISPFSLAANAGCPRILPPRPSPDTSQAPGPPSWGRCRPSWRSRCDRLIKIKE